MYVLGTCPPPEALRQDCQKKGHCHTDGLKQTCFCRLGTKGTQCEHGKYIQMVWSTYVISTVRGCRGHDLMVVGFITTFAISAYYH